MRKELTGIEGNLPRWNGASEVYSKAYAYMLKHGADTLLIDSLNSGDEEAVKANMLRINRPDGCTNEFGKCILVGFDECKNGCSYYAG